MRRALFALLAGGLAVSATGCSDFLTPKPKTFLSSETFYQTPAQLELAINNVYAQLRGLTSTNWRLLGDMRGDLVSLQFNVAIPGFTFQIDEFTEATNDATVTGMYNSIHNTIFESNVVLSRIDNVTFSDPAQKARMVAEVKTIRALAYWQALQFFGLGESWAPNNLAIPLVLTEITNPTDATNLERATVQQVYDQIVKDLIESKPNLPLKGSPGAIGANSGRITRGAATFLLGATYQLNPATQALALKEFEDLGNPGVSGTYDLVTSGSGVNNAYRQVFNPANKNNVESILEVQYTVSSENGNVRQNLVPDMAPLNSEGGGNNGNAQRIAVYGSNGNGQYNPTQNYILSFAGADPSKPDTPFDMRYTGGFGEFCPGSGISGVLGVEDRIRPGNDPSSGQPNTSYPELNIPSVRDPQTKVVRTNCIPYFTKWRWPEQMPVSGRDNNNWIMFRYSDALLRRAESLVKLGRAGEAVPFVNQVRARAGLPALGSVTIADILQERAWELGGEGHRWFDLKRNGVASSTIAAHGAVRKALVKRTTPDSYSLGAGNYRLRYPIRPRDVDLTQCKIKQNPGWGACAGT
jgi:hypothetical protein